MNYINKKFQFLILPLVIIVAGIVMYFVNGGFNYDIEFMGGVRMQVAIGADFENDDVLKAIQDKTGIAVTVQKSGADNKNARRKTPPIDGAQRGEVFNAVKEKYSLADEALVSSSSASASFGQEVQRKAFVYTLIAILCILAYIALRFEWRSAIMAVIALVINVLVMMAVYAITNIPLNTTFIAAMLTVVGYSINNTIVIFDRIRENMKRAAGKKTYSVYDTVNTSISESMGRTVNSTITTLITIVLLYILGVSTIKDFALPLIVGVLAGAYSSIFVAGPFWAVWKEADRQAKIEAAKDSKKK